MVIYLDALQRDAVSSNIQRLTIEVDAKSHQNLLFFSRLCFSNRSVLVESYRRVRVLRAIHDFWMSW